MIPIFQPTVGSEELKAIKEVFNTHWIGGGPKAVKFEEEFKKYIGCKTAISVNSCTAALHLCLLTLDLKETDEILISSITFASTGHAVLFCKAKPILVDINPRTLQMDVDDLRNKITSNTRAIIPVHYGGIVCDMDPILQIAKEHNLVVIEDAANCTGAEYKGKKIGNLDSDFTCFSFEAKKNMTSITPDTPVIIKKAGKIIIEEIGKLDTDIIGEECLAFDQTGKISWQKITNFINHPINDNILKIKLEKGRHINITPNHSVFVYDGKQFITKESSQLKIGDYIAVPRKLPSIKQPINKIDLMNYLKEKIVLDNTKSKIRIGGKGLGGNAGKWINRFLDIDERLCKLLGYWIAEGSIQTQMNKKTKNISFSFNYNEKNSYVKEVSEMIKEIFNYDSSQHIKNNPKTKKPSGITLIGGSTMLSNILIALGCKEGAHNKDIPWIIYHANDKCKWAFIEGLMNGDGHRRSQDGYTPYETLGVCSEKLANGLHYLLLTMGVQSSLSKETSKEGWTKYNCILISKDNQSQSKENCIPKQYVDFYNQKASFSMKRINDKNLKVNDNLMQDVALLKITEIKKEKYNGLVYDFSVAGLENFIGGAGAICLHNTGDGGMITTNKEGDIIDKIKRLRWVGMDKDTSKRFEGTSHPWEYDILELGYKYNMNDIAASVGLVQLSKLDHMNKKRNMIVDKYNRAFKDKVLFTTIKNDKENKNAYWLYILRINKYNRNELLKYLLERGISANTSFKPLHLFTYYKKYYETLGLQASCPIAEMEWDKIVVLPLYPGLTNREVNYIINTVKEFCEICLKK